MLHLSRTGRGARPPHRLLRSSTRSWTAPGRRREARRDLAAAPSRESATARAEFRDLRFHAAGALGEVFMASNAELNREVALKFLKPERVRRPRQPPPLPAGGRGHRPAGAPRRRADLRPGDRRRRRALLRDAVHPRRDAPGRHRRLPRRRQARPRRRPSGRWPCASC